jgi:hypothetical protein
MIEIFRDTTSSLPALVRGGARSRITGTDVAIVLFCFFVSWIGRCVDSSGLKLKLTWSAKKKSDAAPEKRTFSPHLEEWDSKTSQEKAHFGNGRSSSDIDITHVNTPVENGYGEEYMLPDTSVEPSQSRRRMSFDPDYSDEDEPVDWSERDRKAMRSTGHYAALHA